MSDPDTLTARLTEALAGSEGLQALFLGGSRGAGTHDRVSDVDFVAVAAEDDQAAVADRWEAALAATEEVVFRQRFDRGRGVLVNAITRDWVRLDLYVTDAAGLSAGRSQAGLRALYDPDDLRSTLPARLPDARPDRTRVERLTREFIRILGLLHVGLARQEHVLLQTGYGLLRGLLVDLMLEECPLAERGGALHLSKLLPAGDMATLAALPAPPAERQALIDAHVRIAGVFLPRARRLADETGANWPEAFEAATRALLQRETGRDL